jgi:predicted transcriptional regulator
MRNLDQNILKLLEAEPVTPDEVAKRLNISWATANGHLLKLVGEGKVALIRKGRVNIYQTKGTSKHLFQVPRWTRPRPLEELSQELAEYFPRNVTAAEMIERERRKA